MKILLLALLATAAFAHKEHPVSHQMVSDIRRLATTWTPKEPHENPFFYKSIDEIETMFGTYFDYADISTHDTEDYQGSLPEHFDGREEFKGCVHAIRDQAHCGSCWAFGSSEALSDRFCIAGEDVVLSPQYQVSCDSSNLGCNGGNLGKAWNFLKKTGTVKDSDCPYSSGKDGKVPTCDEALDTIKHYKVKSVFHPLFVNKIKKYLMEGPLETGFVVYEDFMNYQSGVYQHVSGKALGGHAIKLVGWGVEDGVEYWLCANSWGVSFGIDGFFKIKIGDSGINMMVYGGVPDV